MNPPNLVQDESISNTATETPLAAIRPSSQIILSKMLNSTKVIPTDSGLPRDWRGLAELSGITSETISFLESKEDPVGELIKIWCRDQDSGCRQFSDLKAFLAVIDRFDVVDDVLPLLENDAVFYKEKVSNRVVRDASVSSLDASIERNVLTIEDSERIHKGLPLTRYDAFILHSDADEDSEFARLVVDKLESEYGLKLCVKDRDLLPGTMFENEVIGRLIEERCNRFLVIFSPSFLESRANHFLVSYAQASALESRVRKIVPCIYKKCELPPSVRYSFCIVYNRSGKLWNFWDKLSQSLRPNSSASKAVESCPLSSDPVVIAPANHIPTDYSNKHNTTLTESLSWWDAEKPTCKSSSSYSNPLSSGISNGTLQSKSSKSLDTLSIRSDAHLISSETDALQPSSKGSKWYKKIISPIKKKKDKEKAHVTQKPVAE